MKLKILWIVAITITLICIYAFKQAEIKDLFSGIKLQKIYFEKNPSKNFVSDWESDELLEKINLSRESSGLSKLKENNNLNRSAKARLSVILSENDFDGTVTGLSLNKSIDNAGYKASLVGELVLTGYFKTNDPLTYWNSHDELKSTLNHPEFVDAGIAIKNEADKVDVYILLASPRAVAKPTIKISPWGGVDLWNEINKRRVEMGVNPLKEKSELCTIASIRLNQLLEIGKLDGHAGFVPTLERDDLSWISEKYNLSEYLIQGYQTPKEAVSAWENTLGHRSLLAGGQYVWGCVYAQNLFGVAIAAY